MWSAASTLLLLLVAGVTLACTAAPAATLAARLAPPLRWHLRFLRREYTGAGGAGRLATMHLLSALLAVPAAVLAACVASLWLYTEVLLGDEADRGGLEYRAYAWLESRWSRFVGGRPR